MYAPHANCPLLTFAAPHMNAPLNKNSSQIHQIFAFIIPFAVGFGIYFWMIPVFLIALAWQYFKNDEAPFFHAGKRLGFEAQFLVFFMILGLFLGCYRGIYIPYHPQIYALPGRYFTILLAITLGVSLWILSFRNNRQCIQFVWCFCLGTLLFSLLTIGTSLALEPTPYYGRLVNILTPKVFSARSYINSPGISNLLCFFPIAFMAGLLLKPGQRPWGFWVLGILGFALSLGSALVINQRSYFVVTLLMAPILVGLFLVIQRAWHTLAWVLIPLACYPTLWLANSLLPNSPWTRFLNGDIMNDARFQMLSYWFSHLIKDPFTRIEVGPAQWQDLQWFHNFFADVHRFSGFWSLATALLLFGFIFYRLILLIRTNQNMGLFLTAIAIPIFLIMNTSVVPEGERQPFFLLIFIGVICEKLLAFHKKNLVST